MCDDCLLHGLLYALLISGTWVQMKRKGVPLFPRVSPAAVNTELRRMLNAAGVDDATCYRSHDIRRG